MQQNTAHGASRAAHHAHERHMFSICNATLHSLMCAEPHQEIVGPKLMVENQKVDLESLKVMWHSQQTMLTSKSSRQCNSAMQAISSGVVMLSELLPIANLVSWRAAMCKWRVMQSMPGTDRKTSAESCQNSRLGVCCSKTHKGLSWST